MALTVIMIILQLFAVDQASMVRRAYLVGATGAHIREHNRLQCAISAPPIQFHFHPLPLTACAFKVRACRISTLPGQSVAANYEKPSACLPACSHHHCRLVTITQRARGRHKLEEIEKENFITSTLVASWPRSRGKSGARRRRKKDSERDRKLARASGVTNAPGG